MGMMEACCSQVQRFLGGCFPPVSLSTLQQETHFTSSAHGLYEAFAFNLTRCYLEGFWQVLLYLVFS